MIRAVIESQDPGEKWDAFVAAHPAGHLMQSRAWAAAQREAGWKPVFLSLLEGESFRAVALCLRLSLPCTGLAILYCPRGPVLDYHHPSLVEACAIALRQCAREQNAFLVQADPAIPLDQHLAHDALERMGFRRQERHGLFRILQPRWVMRIQVDAYGGPEGLLAALPEKTRYNVRLAERKGVTVASRTDHEACRIFHRLLESTGGTKGFPVRGFAYHQALWRHCVQAGMGEYLFAEREGRLLAGIQVLWFGSRAWYMYGASSDVDRNLMPTYLLQWEGIRRAWERGCRCYDMRGVYSPTPDPMDPEFGVYDFKRKFGAQMVKLLGEYDFVLQPKIYAAWRFLERAAQTPAAWGFWLLGRLKRLR